MGPGNYPKIRKPHFSPFDVGFKPTYLFHVSIYLHQSSLNYTFFLSLLYAFDSWWCKEFNKVLTSQKASQIEVGINTGCGIIDGIASFVYMIYFLLIVYGFALSPQTYIELLNFFLPPILYLTVLFLESSIRTLYKLLEATQP